MSVLAVTAFARGQEAQACFEKHGLELAYFWGHGYIVAFMRGGVKQKLYKRQERSKMCFMFTNWGIPALAREGGGQWTIWGIPALVGGGGGEEAFRDDFWGGAVFWGYLDVVFVREVYISF